MHTPNFVILYVDKPLESAAFYTALLGREPVEASPGFVLFALDKGFRLGLWLRQAVEPAATDKGGGAEIVFALDAPEAVDAIHAAWAARGLPIAQAPANVDFGRTFVALDPDGHRLRVYWPNDSQARPA
ncbi:VOC family protein [Mesorhizobium sp. CN5-321]|jgi:catechol 2,3-dioxygenase-like lactoylglutathione lyase family enzyme|uniref:VOC family protein n=1 Tax=Mesorhizobium hunchu TaxID=3157708 RepID=UPI0032B7C50F